MVLSTEIWTQETINGSTTSTRHLQFEEDLGSIWRSRKTRKHDQVLYKQQEAVYSWNAPGHFHIFPTSKWLFMMSLNIWHYPHGSTGPILFGTQTPIFLASSSPTRSPQWYIFFAKMHSSLMTRTIWSNSNLLPHCLSLFSDLWGFLHPLKNGARGLHDVFQNWIRTKKCLKNSTKRRNGSLFGWLQKNDYMTSPLWVAGSRLIQKLTSIGGFAPWV